MPADLTNQILATNYLPECLDGQNGMSTRLPNRASPTNNITANNS